MTSREARPWVSVVYGTCWLVVVGLYLWWPLTHLGAYGWSNDEGLYVQRAALANAGYPLYRDVLLNKPPLLVWILQLGFRVWGQTLPVARLTVVGLTLFGVLALGVVSRQIWGGWAGLTTAALWVGLPEVPHRAHAVMSDLPALAFAMAGIAAAGAFRRRPRRALLIHPLLLYLAPVLFAVLLAPKPNRGEVTGARARIWPDLVVLAGAGIVVALLVLVAVDRTGFITWVLEYNIKTAAGAKPTELATNWSLIAGYLHDQLALITMAALGTAALSTRRRGRWGLAVVAGWFVATVVVLLVWSPLWLHYLLFLAVPLVVVAGGGAAWLWKWALSRDRCQEPYHRAYIILSVLMLGAAMWFVVGEWRESARTLNPDRSWSPERLMARAFLKKASDPEDFVVTDDPLLAFAAGRLVPPTLTEASYRQIYLGYLTSGDLVASTLRYKAPIALFATGRLEEVPNFERWVSAVAAGRRRDFGTLRAYELEHGGHAPEPVNAAVGDALILDGYELSGDLICAGDQFTTTLHWRRVGWVRDDYHVFVHLVGEDGGMVAQHDGLPLLGAYSTSEWEEGLLLPDPHPLEVDAGAPSGEYLLVAGMYHWPSLERLPACRSDGQPWLHDLIILTEVEVVSSPALSGLAASHHL